MVSINDPLLGGDSKTRNHHILNSILLGVALFFLYCVMLYGTALGTQEAYGNFIFYAIILVTAFISPFLISKTREKLAMIICSLIWLTVFLLETYTNVPVITDIILPFALMFLWTAVGGFMFVISSRSNIGLNFGILFSIMGLYAGFQIAAENMAPQSVSYVAVFIIFIVISIVLFLLLGNPGTNVEKEHPSESLKCLKNKNFLLLIPVMLYLGMGESFVQDIFYNPSVGYFKVYGIVYSVTAIVLGFLSDKIQRKYILIALTICGIIASILTIIFFYHPEDTPQHLPLYATTVLFAICNAGIYVQVYCAAGLMFSRKSLSVAALVRLFIEMGSFIAFIFFQYINQGYIYTLLALLVIGSILFVYVLHNSYRV
ncbi:hypothetical protein DICPUDRAFT_152734 [Dictyostelium purpureum]|uniref:Major facilitator superfamily (MFS) profile domain-containing protein n=1 Tax=Dictyostelium purpureum TaxID=5786 RepID=F0ZM54_DICPU|nr:uncharacterized protein DICPUDRAFT_152734 [Dictyostelium purpureum]EGC34966.1 hypothetical protein DICPUDRAFT_152734 [Dictyostelium purpureum]|eukprot:XP_003288491.1 hypothetical protein DICPUDRAFT_152734 [Dictyostelium purpureum]